VRQGKKIQESANQKLKALQLLNTVCQKIAQQLIVSINKDEKEAMKIIQNQENSLQLLRSAFKDGKEDIDDEGMKIVIKAGIAQALIFIFQIRELDKISPIYADTFNSITGASDQIALLLVKKKPFQGLIRLLDHTDMDIVTSTIDSISNIVNAGSDSTPETKKHPYFEVINSYGGIEKLMKLFRDTHVGLFRKDAAAVCIGKLFRAREIPNSQHRKEIVEHLKNLSLQTDRYWKDDAYAAIQCLSQNKKIIKDIMSDLQMMLNGTDEQIREINNRKESICQILYSLLQIRQEYEYRRIAIEIGIADLLLKVFKTLDLEKITQIFVKTFFVFTYPYNKHVNKALFELRPFQSLLRILNHSDKQIVNFGILSIDNILYGGAVGSDPDSVHPYFDEFKQVGGITKISAMFKKETDKFNKNEASICLGIVYRARDIGNTLKEVIDHLKSIANHSDKVIQNLIEIKKNDFQIPDEDDDEIEEQQDGEHKDEDEDNEQYKSLKEKDDDEETIEDIQEEDQDEEKDDDSNKDDSNKDDSNKEDQDEKEEDDEKEEESQDDSNKSIDQTGWKEIELDCDPIPDDIE
ncbi:MAG: hypothetical protein EZS28_037413, partial [Streblomastix strix]